MTYIFRCFEALVKGLATCKCLQTLKLSGSTNLPLSSIFMSILTDVNKSNIKALDTKELSTKEGYVAKPLTLKIFKTILVKFQSLQDLRLNFVSDQYVNAILETIGSQLIGFEFYHKTSFPDSWLPNWELLSNCHKLKRIQAQFSIKLWRELAKMVGLVKVGLAFPHSDSEAEDQLKDLDYNFKSSDSIKELNLGLVPETLARDSKFRQI